MQLSPTQRKSRTKPPERRRRILEAAAVLFADGGLHGVTIRDIANSAAVHLYALYREFENKDAIYLSACEYVFRNVVAKFDEILASTCPPEERIYRYTEALYRDLKHDRVRYKILVRETVLEEGAVMEFLASSIWAPHFDALKRLFGDVLKQNDERPMAFDLYVQTFGYIQMSFFGQFGRFTAINFEDSSEAATHILANILPGINWLEISHRQRF